MNDLLWTMIDGSLEGERAFEYARLVDALSLTSADSIRQFSDELSAALFALDTPVLYEAVTEEFGEYVGADSFLFWRCAVVTRGRRLYEEILQDVGAVVVVEDFAEAEELLSVAESAYKRATGSDWDHWPAFEIETGSNSEAWGNSGPTPEADENEPSSSDNWIHVGVGEIAPLPAGVLDSDDFEDARDAAVNAAMKDHSREALWALGFKDMDVLLALGAESRRPLVRKRGDSIEVIWSGSIPESTFREEKPEAWLREPVREAVDAVFAKLSVK